MANNGTELCAMVTTTMPTATTVLQQRGTVVLSFPLLPSNLQLQGLQPNSKNKRMLTLAHSRTTRRVRKMIPATTGPGTVKIVGKKLEFFCYVKHLLMQRNFRWQRSTSFLGEAFHDLLRPSKVKKPTFCCKKSICILKLPLKTSFAAKTKKIPRNQWCKTVQLVAEDNLLPW